MNPARVGYFRKVLENSQKKVVVDIGCGGGLVTNQLAAGSPLNLYSGGLY